MTHSTATYIGSVASVNGGIVSIRLREDMPSTLIMLAGESYRVGQIGAFLRLPLGYTQLYGVCTQVGAAAVPINVAPEIMPGQRWLTVVLFGESVGGHFERGVSQYPTVGDEVHLVTARDLEVIYQSTVQAQSITLGDIAASSGIKAKLSLNPLVVRHSAIVGSTGAGKSNLVAIILDSIATQGFPASRVLVVDPHGEYGSVVGVQGRVYKVTPDIQKGERQLYVPYWALPFDELQDILLGDLQPPVQTSVRDELLALKRAAAVHLPNAPPLPAITADSPIPFSIRKLWFELDDFERQTFQASDLISKMALVKPGNPDSLESNQYPPVAAGSKAPFKNVKARGITRNLELMRSRLLDGRFRFLFEPGDEYTPTTDGKTNCDLDQLVSSWVGHDRPITVLDVSGLPSEILSMMVGTMLRIIYETLFWAGSLPVSGRQQPLLVVLEEAHIFLPEGTESSAHRTIGRIAKEGRKYGVGLMVVTQRPGEIDSTILSQCGTMIALRLTNSSDRAKVQAAMPDDLGSLASMLPSLRTGEGIVIGEAMPIPSRIRFRRSVAKLEGDDPNVAKAWAQVARPDPKDYRTAIENWRLQTIK